MAERSQPALRRHLPELDGLRGLAVLYVFCFHIGGGSSSANPLVRLLGQFTSQGWTGVTLFFVLSGFLISGILWDQRDRTSWVRSFYVRRALRIFPLYYTVLLLVFVSTAVPHSAAAGWSRVWPCLLFLQDVPGPLANSINVDSRLPLFHFWSLAVEEQFYLLWPVLLLRQRTARGALRLCTLAIAVGLLIQLLAFRFRFFAMLPTVFPRTADLAAGAWLAIAYRSRLQPLLRSWALALIVPAAALCIGIAGSKLVYRANLLSVTTVPVFACLLVLTLDWPPVRSLMRWRWLRWIGTISYGIYVYHVLFSRVFTSLACRLARGEGSMRFFLVRAVVFSIGTLIAAVLSKRFLEEPFTRLKDKLAGAPAPSLDRPVAEEEPVRAEATP